MYNSLIILGIRLRSQIKEEQSKIYNMKTKLSNPLDLFLGRGNNEVEQKELNQFKIILIAFLAINPLLLHTVGPFYTSIAMLLQFLFILFRSTTVYPAISGGLLVSEAIILKLVTTEGIWHEWTASFDVFMLVLFMVAAVSYLKQFMTYMFVNLLVKVQNKIVLSVIICLAAAVLSAFLDALTVTAVLITVVSQLYDIILNFRAGKSYGDTIGDHTDDDLREALGIQIQDYRQFLRSIMIHGLIGTALGGVMTMVGEPQNVMLVKIINGILETANMPLWDFQTFFIKMLPVTIPTLIFGLMTTTLLEKFKLFGFGKVMTPEEREVIMEWRNQYMTSMNQTEKLSLMMQGVVALLLVFMLITHFAEVGLIGLIIIIFASATTGKKDEHDFVPAFEEGGPFLVVLGVLFAFVAMLHEQHTFMPAINFASTLGEHDQRVFFFSMSGFLSAVSDNVFVAKIFMDAAIDLVKGGQLNIQEIKHLESLTVSINAGTNIFSVLTPNGQAAFLFFLTSALAKKKLLMGWTEIFKMSLPYAVVMIATATSCIMFLL